MKNAINGPENAEHEIRKAYNSVVEACVTYAWNQEAQGACTDELLGIYRHAFDCFRAGNKLAAERWARTAKHLARALWHEAKLSYLEPHATELPFLEGATAVEYDIQEDSHTTEDLLDSVSQVLPSGMKELPEAMRRYLTRGKKHLGVLEQGDYVHELLRAERIKAAYEYGRVLECMALAYEADPPGLEEKEAA
jgi:hypothetical protein